MKPTVLLLAVAGLILSGCSESACNREPLCLNPIILTQRGENQPEFEPGEHTVRLFRGQQSTLTLRLNRKAWPDSLPVYFTGSTSNIRGPFSFTQFSGTGLFNDAGVSVRASANPVIGNTVQLTVTRTWDGRSLVPDGDRTLTLNFVTQLKTERWQSPNVLSVRVEAIGP
jgi:hypothetical protein